MYVGPFFYSVRYLRVLLKTSVEVEAINWRFINIGSKQQKCTVLVIRIDRGSLRITRLFWPTTRSLFFSCTSSPTTTDSSNSNRKLVLREKEETQTMKPTQASGTTLVQTNSTPMQTSNGRALQVRRTASATTTTSKTSVSSAVATKRRPGV